MSLFSSGGKEEADSLLKLDTVFLKKLGYLTPNTLKIGTIEWNCSGASIGSISIIAYTFTNALIHVSYTNTTNGQTEELNYNIQLTTTKCNLGGSRWWLECPACDNRVRTLYKVGSYLFAVAAAI